MRILDEKRDKSVEQITLLLTQSEAEELQDSIKRLLDGGKEPEAGQHTHIPSEDYQKEITIALYTPDNVDSFNHRCQKLIRENT